MKLESPSCFCSEMGISLCKHWVESMLFLAAEKSLLERIRTDIRDPRHMKGTALYDVGKGPLLRRHDAKTVHE